MKILIPALSFFMLFNCNIANGQRAVSDDTTSMELDLENVIILSSYAKNNVEKPVVLSTINSNKIATKLSNQEFPEILKSTPSIYATKMGGGYGDSRVTLRGFGSENISILINGIPINGMENGSVYWSNWAGLADITNRIQVQRGIGLSKLGVYSVGGTINIITNSAEAMPGGWVQYGIGNDGYQKMGFSLSTGQTKNGWALTMMGGRTSGNGYIMGTEFEAWNYFVNLSKRINDRHSLSFTAFGAPQWHNRRSNKQSILDYNTNPNGIRMNTAFGYINGKVVPTYSGYNEYHKPQVSLNHFWHIGKKSYLSTSAYASMATGGGRKVYGNKNDANRLQYDYRTGKPIYDKGTLVTDMTPEGFIDYGPLMNDNRNSETGSKAVFTMGTNSHNWYGLISSFTSELNNNFKITAGIDTRYYRGFHYDKIENLLGGAYFIDNSLAWREKDSPLRKGDRVGQDYYSEILWLGGFVQGEYNTEKVQAFASAALTSHQYRRADRGKYGAFGDQEKYPEYKYKTSWKNFLPVSLKAGVNYRFTPQHRVFVNGGYTTKAPLLENVYSSNELTNNITNEKIISGEIGYNYLTDKVDILVSGYITSWKDKSVAKPIGGWNGPRVCIPNLDALHKGIELDIKYSPVYFLNLEGYVSLGEWRWVDDVNFTYINENWEKVGEYNAYIKNLYVGNAPQTSAYVSANVKCFKGMTLGVDFNYYARHYADFSAIDRIDKNDIGQSWKMPDYGTMDLNMDYELKLNKTGIRVFANVNNVFNKRYITDAVDNVITSTDGTSGHNWNNAVVWYGFGRTWTVGVKVNF